MSGPDNEAAIEACVDEMPYVVEVVRFFWPTRWLGM